MIPEKLQHILLELRLSKWIGSLLFNSKNVYIVGGSVRDGFLNKQIKDIYLIVEGLSLNDIKNYLSTFGKVDIVGESFSVIKFRPFGYEGEPFDIAIPRMDRKKGQGHKGFEIITEGVDIVTDLKRRDFTVNSIAINVKTNELVDPFNGLSDLSHFILRATDETAFIEDPLRILRGIQFSARFGFHIESKTMNLMIENSHLIKEISGERIFEEFQKIILKNGNTDLAFRLINRTGLDKSLFGHEMDVQEFGKLDEISFFYILGILGGIDPVYFVKNRLKGNSLLEKNVKVLSDIMKIPIIIKEDEFRFLILKAIEKAPLVINSVILPKRVDDLILKMQKGEIPISTKLIQVNGDDVMSEFPELKDQQIGLLIRQIVKDALMNNFDWKNRKKSLEFLNTLKIIYISQKL